MSAGGAESPRIFISAGEPSGDLHGAHVVRALRARYPGVLIEGFGGPRMAEAGTEIRYPIERLSAMGFVEVLGKIPAHLRLLRRLTHEFERRRYDLVILIDYPGFHIRVAQAAHRAGVRVLYYIAPQLWAWRPERARRLVGAVDRMAVILPFEEAFFRRLGLQADFVGHPLVDRDALASRSEARQLLGVADGARILGIFPGSRSEEVRRHWPLFRSVALSMLAERRCDRAIVAGTDGGAYLAPGPIEIHRGDPAPIFAAADAALAKSGTTTLEAALADTPMVVAYLTGRWTYALAVRLMTVKWISLVNLVAETAVVPEFWRRPVSAAQLCDALRPLLDPTHPSRAAQCEALADVRRRLGSPGAADRVAAIAAELLGR